MERTCVECKEIKDISEFHKHLDGYVFKCKKCTKESRKLYYMRNKEKENISALSYYHDHKDTIKIHKVKYDHTRRSVRMCYDYNRVDKKKSLTCDLTSEWLELNILNKPCTYCGSLIQIGCDRIDNTKGHTMDNVIPCCWSCNRLRGNIFSIEEMYLIGEFLKTKIYPLRFNKEV